MRRSGLILAVMAAVVLGAAVPAMADELVGQLVDHACYTTRGPKSSGVEHAKCAISCAQKGHRLALVTAKGEVYMVTGALTQSNNAKLIPLMNVQVVLTGTVGEFRVQPSEAQRVAVPGDARRGGGAEDVVTTRTVRKDDFREGDLRQGDVKFIEAVSIKRLSLPR